MHGTEVPSPDELPRATAIESERLRLTPLVPEDAAALFRVLDDEALHAFVGGRPDRLEELRARIDGWSSQRSPDGEQAWLNWLVRSTQDARVLGTMQATVERDANGLAAEVAWTIGISGAATPRRRPARSSRGSESVGPRGSMRTSTRTTSPPPVSLTARACRRPTRSSAERSYGEPSSHLPPTLDNRGRSGVV